MYFAAAAKISIRDCMHIDSVIMYFIGLSFASVFLMYMFSFCLTLLLTVMVNKETN